MILEYLAAADERRMGEAGAYLAPNAIHVFPQGRFHDLEAVGAAMASRYRSIRKTYETWDVMDAESETVVVATGTLSGENIHGLDFAGVRFCDRFVVRDGLISEQHVWNDLAESRALEQR